MYSLKVAPGDYTFLQTGFFDGGCAYYFPAPLSVTENTVYDLTIPLGDVDVRVQDSAGNPIAGASVNLYGNFWHSGPGDWYSGCNTTGPLTNGAMPI